MATYRCDECQHSFDHRGIGPHQKKRGHTGKTLIEEFTPAISTNGLKPKVEVVSTITPPLTGSFKELSDFMVLERSDGTIWLAERIR